MRYAAGPYVVERIDHDSGGIAYEVSVEFKSMHVAFYEYNCLDQGITAKHQATLYAHSPELVEVLKMTIDQIQNARTPKLIYEPEYVLRRIREVLKKVE